MQTEVPQITTKEADEEGTSHERLWIAPDPQAATDHSPPSRAAANMVLGIACIVSLLSGVVLVESFIGLGLLGPLRTLAKSVNQVAAAAFLMLGVLLRIFVRMSDGEGQENFRRLQPLALGLAVGVSLIGFVSLFEYRSDSSGGTDPHSQMSLLCSTTVLVLGVVFAMRALHLAPRLRDSLALCCFTLGYLAVMGYVYGAKNLYHIGATAVPVPSAICIMLIAVGGLLLPPHHGFMRPVLSKGPGGLLVRRLLPVALFVAPMVDLVQAQLAIRIGGSSMALVGLANVAMLVVLIWGTGRSVHLAQAHRRGAEQSVRATQGRLLMALQAADGGAWDLDLVRNEGWWSPEMYRLWGVQPGAPIRLENAMELIDPRDRELVMTAVRKAVAEDTSYDCEFRLRSNGAEERWMASRGQVYYNDSGEATRLIGISLDISSRKTAEMRLREMNAALARSNVDLQRFAHVAAHDLQTPLRGIGSFAELLKHGYEDRLDARGREWLDRILTCSGHLHSLIRDLLEYSSVDAQPLDVQAVELDVVLDHALSLLRTEIHDSQCVITRDALPVVAGEPAQLLRVFLNLLGNAIKYRKANPPKVHISAEQVDSAWRVSVRDNGIGIDPRHSTRIFEMFERLHNANEYPGTGIGLALCQRVIERHGGHISVRSTPGEGSVFVFTLPIKE